MEARNQKNAIFIDTVSSFYSRGLVSTGSSNFRHLNNLNGRVYTYHSTLSKKAPKFPVDFDICSSVAE